MRHAFLYLGYGIIHAPRRFRCLFRQLLNFSRHNGKAFTRFAGGGRLDGGIQSQQVGLIGNVAYYVNNLTNFLTLNRKGIDGLGNFRRYSRCLLHVVDGTTSLFRSIKQ
jgi:hypothetical protein